MKKLNYIFILLNYFCFAQSDVPLSLRAQFNGNYGYTIIGNTMNEFDNWQNPAPPCQMLTQSSANLNLLPNQNIVEAYLYWSGVGDGNLNPIINLNGLPYSSSSSSIAFPENTNVNYFGSFANVTTQVQNTGNSTYSLSNIDLNPIIGSYCGNGIFYLGWSIIVIYEQFGISNIQLNIYDGLNVANTFFNNGVTNFTLNNLNIIDTNNAQMTYIAFNGSNNLFYDEFIKINNNTLSNALNPPNNPFNSTNSFTGSTSLWNMDIDTFDISAFVNIGDTQANISFGSAYQRFIQTLVTSIRSELPDATGQINQVTGQEICNNRNLTVNYTVANTNSNAVLQVVPVSFYANGVLLQTVNTPSVIAVGGSLALQTSVVIPASITSPFDLKIIVDNNVANASTIAESNENNNVAVLNITLLGNTIAPTFNLANTFCAGANVPVLPSTSSNSIAGTWSPSVISNQVNGSYVFTPNASQCANSFTLNTTISPLLTPTFNITNTFCAGENVPVLPTTSINNIAGTWSPSVILNQVNGVYVFTPNAGQCASGFTLNVTVSPLITPTFNLANTFCAGANVPVLPITSSNNIAGNWSPSVISNQNNGVYFFTPNIGQCASGFTLNVTVSPLITPTFNLANTFCAGANVPVLPSTSINNIAGTWSSSVISNQVNGSYFFTPNANQCASGFTLNVTVSQLITPTFNIANTFCAGANVPVLPITSSNSIAGTWSPSVISNQNNGVYFFTPNSNQCANGFSLNTVIESQTPSQEKIEICFDENSLAITSKILDSKLNANDYDFVWTKDNRLLNQTTSQIAVLSIGNYKLIANPKISGCQKIINFIVDAIQPIKVNISVSEDFALESFIKIESFGGNGEYLYSFNNLSFQKENIYFVKEGGDILIKIKDSSNCYDISKTITIWKYPAFFTPNNDGFNDTWNINTLKNIKIDIFDRFGKLIKQLKTGDNWDGTFNSQLLIANDYWFVIYYDENKIFKGHFALKR